MSRIQQIFRDHGPEYLKRYGRRMPAAHRKVIEAIIHCRNGHFGQHLFECAGCGQTHVAQSSCGNRHCPVCQNDKAAHWVYRQQLRLLPANYFLATFTVPPELWALARQYPREVYQAMFKASADSLRTLEADKRFVGCHVAGFFGILHTWGRQLQYHPHIHYVIPGGGLSADRDRWVASSGHFLVHVRALSRMFRGKLHAELQACGLFNQTARAVWSRPWVVHCKAVGNGRAAMKYLGAYVFRVAISDARIVDYDGNTVRFKYYRVGSRRPRYAQLDVLEFIRRFLQHVLPHGFMKIRHYGFLSPNFSVSLQRIRELICVLYEILRDQLPPPCKPRKTRPLCCPTCGKLMRWVCFIPAVRTCKT